MLSYEVHVILSLSINNPPLTMDGMANDDHLDNTMRAIHAKKPVPQIDFTLHTMEDGTQVSTQERVCKGTIVP